MNLGVIANLSINSLLDLLSKTINARSQTHVHELRLGVHLQSAEDGLFDLELDDELLALVLGVGLESCEHLLLLLSGEAVSRNDGDLLFLVELLVKLGVLLSDLLDEHQALVLGEDLNEADGNFVEVAGLTQTCVEGADLLATDTGILGEHLETFAVSVDLSKEFHVFEDVVKGTVLGGGGEKDGCVAAWNGVLLRGGLVVGSRLNLLDITK